MACFDLKAGYKLLAVRLPYLIGIAVALSAVSFTS